MPEISIIVPCRNAGNALFECAQMLDRQTLEVEAIFVDDASDDDAFNALAAKERNRKNFLFLRHDTPRGVSAARNTGLRAAH
ncbi:MAG: glycosyltransferase, partial [Victivallaceae bacterium]|nr:glycosyltransferase [Victivallaceae bacterium]